MEGGGKENDGGGAITDGPELDGSDAITINVRCSDGKKIIVQVSLDSSVESLKSVIAKNSDIPVVQQRLINNGRLLKDDRTLRSYDLEAKHTVYLIRAHIPDSSSDTSSTDDEGTMDGSGDSPPSTIDLSRFPGVEPRQIPWVQNPDMTQETMDQLITNPDAIRIMTMNNPQSREVIDRNPNLTRIYNDPDIYRTMAECRVICEFIARVGGAGGGAPSHPAGTDRSAPPVGVGGLEIPGLDRMLGFTPDPIAVSQLMQSPAISQLIHRLLANPQNTNPILNPQYREIMRSPVLNSTISQLTSPQTRQEMMALHQSLCYLLGQEPITSSWDVGQTSGGTGEPRTESQPLINTSSGLETSGSTTPNNNLNNVGPEELYASELAQLEEMGFHDTRLNLEALTATKGNIPAAVDRLHGGQ